MGTVSTYLSNVVDWSFLNEPLYRWAIFIVAITFMLASWNGILRYMR